MRTLYHGTAAYNLDSFKQHGARLSPRRYGKPAFCTSHSFEEAAYFALRKTPANDWSQTGIVLEFDSSGLRQEEYILYDSKGLLRDEKEVRVTDTRYLLLAAFYEYCDGDWRRIEYDKGISKE